MAQYVAPLAAELTGSNSANSPTHSASANGAGPNGIVPNMVNTNGNGVHSAAPQRPWSVEESRKLYSIRDWGNGYFDINEKRNVAVHPKANLTGGEVFTQTLQFDSRVKPRVE